MNPAPDDFDHEELARIAELESLRPGLRQHLTTLFEQSARLQSSVCAESIASGSWNAARVAAHSIRGVAVSLGARRLAAIAARLELACEARNDADARAPLAELDAAIDAALGFLQRWQRGQI